MTAATQRIHRRLMREEEPEWIVWTLVIGMLIVGLIMKISVTGRTENISAAGVSLNYPATWSQQTEPDALLFASDPFSSAQAPTGISIRQVPAAEIGRNMGGLVDVALAWSTRQSRELAIYRALSVEQTTIGGRQAVMVDYAYVPQPSRSGRVDSVPVVARAQDYLVQQGDTVLIITLRAEADAFEPAADTWQAILATVNLP